MQFSTLILTLASSAAIVSALPTADNTGAVDKRSPEPEARQWCGRKGEPCWLKVKRDAMPEAEARQWCGRKGEPCWIKVKRDADPEPLPEALALAAAVAAAHPEAEAEPRQWCGRKGEPCWAKVKRDAIPEAEARQWCGRKGEPCWFKVKRDEE